MSQKPIHAVLRSNLKRRVKVVFLDGEIIQGMLDDLIEDEDIMVLADVSSNFSEKYAKWEKPHHVVARISEVDSCECAEF